MKFSIGLLTLFVLFGCSSETLSDPPVWLIFVFTVVAAIAAVIAAVASVIQLLDKFRVNPEVSIPAYMDEGNRINANNRAAKGAALPHMWLLHPTVALPTMNLRMFTAAHGVGLAFNIRNRSLRKLVIESCTYDTQNSKSLPLLPLDWQTLELTPKGSVDSEKYMQLPFYQEQPDIVDAIRARNLDRNDCDKGRTFPIKRLHLHTSHGLVSLPIYGFRRQDIAKPLVSLLCAHNA